MWGMHLSLDMFGCNEKVRDRKVIEEWIRELVKRIDMVPYGEPQIVHFGKNDPKLAGWTALQLIETSNITAHFCDNTGEAYIDVFSCKEFDKDVVTEHFKEVFEPAFITTRIWDRG